MTHGAWIEATKGKSATGKGYDTTLRADSVHISGDQESTGNVLGSGIYLYNYSSALTEPSQMRIETGTLSIVNAGAIMGDTMNNGPAANILVTATESARIRGIQKDVEGNVAASTISSLTLGDGLGGTIHITTPELLIAEYGNISTMAGSNTKSTGDAGNIDIQVDRLFLKKGGYIDTSTRLGGKAGDISISAKESVSLSGYIENIFYGEALAASITLTVERLELDSGSQISTSNGGGVGAAGDIVVDAKKSISISGSYLNPEDGVQWISQIQSRTFGEGDAGSIKIDTGALRIRNEGRITAAAKNERSGKAGDIQIHAARIDLASKATLIAENKGTIPGGSIQLQAEAIRLENSGISLSTTQTDGGDITVEADNHFALIHGEISTSVAGGTGNGGNISISNPDFTILNDSKIIAQANEGSGGNIHIRLSELLQTPIAVIDASSKVGMDGEVVIDSPIRTDMTAGLIQHEYPYLDISELLQDPCAQKKRGGGSSLTVRPWRNAANTG